MAETWQGALPALAAGRLELGLEIAGGEIPAADIDVAGIRVEGDLALAASVTGDVQVSVGRIRGGPAMPLPLREHEVKAKVVLRRHVIDVRGKLHDYRRRAEVLFSGRYEREEESADLEFQTGPVRISSPTLTPAHIAPELGDVFREAEGEFEARGIVRWHPQKKLQGNVELAIREVSVSTDAARIEGINGVIRFAPPWPLQTPPAQEIAIRRIDLGLDLTDGRVRFGIDPDGVLDIDSAVWRFAGGSIETDGRIDLRAPERNLELRFFDLSLRDLLSRVRLDGLEGRGRVSGRLPVSITDENVRVAEGRLHAQPGGQIRYRPTASLDRLTAGQPGFDVLLPALRNLTFQKLELGVDGDLRQDMQLRLELDGANPNYQNGQPIELNLNLDARLADLLRAGEWIDRVPDHIERKLESFRKRSIGVGAGDDASLGSP